MTTSVRRLLDGTYNIVQRASAPGAFTPEALQAFYWHALRASTFGLVRFRRNSIRILGVGPVLLRFGPTEGGRRPIVGGVFSRRPYGAIRWLSVDGEIAGQGPLAAPPKPRRDRPRPHRRTRAGDDAGRCDDRGRRKRRVRDDSRTGQSSTGDDLPTLGLGRDAAGRSRMKVPTVARDDRIWEIVGGSRTSFDDAVRAALAAAKASA